MSSLKALPVFLLIIQATYVFANDYPEYVGRETCVSCHQKETQKWIGSHHDLAMQHANDDSVLGDFSDAEFEYAGFTSKFFREGNKYIVSTDGPDGKLQNYEIKYTFGVTPLQQYLVELKGGRLQALTIAWDSRSKKEGGQRWFHLYPNDEITFKNELHWTRPSFNWNGMCAECHSTNLQKNYNRQEDIFDTSWSEIDVSCESCHGPASKHLIWAEKKEGWQLHEQDKGLTVTLDERKDVRWNLNQETGNAHRNIKRESDKEIEVCAQCHSRRSALSNDYKPGKSFLNHYRPRLLDEEMYFADGQIQEEVYVYGSFLQSKMYQAGVTCSDCHEPHSLELRAESNGVCLQCHAAEIFDTKEHHFHKTNSTGAQCAECHMPQRDYMVVDPRHDHSIRIPRPDLTVKIGTPSACNNCHQDKSAEWSAEYIKQWYKREHIGYQKYAEAINAGRHGEPRAGELLDNQIRSITTPTIAKATAITLLPPYLDQSNIHLIQEGLKDKDALIRLSSVTALDGLPQALLVKLLFPLLDDPVRSVRIEVARLLADIKPSQLQGKYLSAYKAAAKEYIDSQLVNADRPEAQLNLGNYFAKQGEYKKAELAYKASIKLDNAFIAAYINLADFYRAQHSEDKAENTLREALQMVPENAELNFALGLLQVRKKQIDAAIISLRRAANLDSVNVQYIYTYAVALNSAGQKDLAIDVLQDAHKRFSSNVNILEALVAFHRDAGNIFAAQTYLNKLNDLKLNKLRE